MTASSFDIERQLLFDAIYLKYHYDFRGYAEASAKRRVRTAMTRLACATVSQLQDRVLHDPAAFADVLDVLTVPVSEMFRDPGYFKALRERVVPMLRTYPSLKMWVAGCSTGEEAYSLAILLREEGLLERTSSTRPTSTRARCSRPQAGIYDIERVPGSARTIAASGGRGSLSDYYTARYGRAVLDKGLSGISCSPTTAWPPTASSRRSSWCRAATC